MVFSYLDYLKNQEKIDNDIKKLSVNSAKNASLTTLENGDIGLNATTNDLNFANMQNVQNQKQQLDIAKGLNQQAYNISNTSNIDPFSYNDAKDYTFWLQQVGEIGEDFFKSIGKTFNVFEKVGSSISDFFSDLF